MSVVLAIAEKDLRLLLRDRAAFFWAAVFPLVFAVLFGAMFPSEREGQRSVQLRLAVVDDARSPASLALIDGLRGAPGLVVETATYAVAAERVRKGEVIATLHLPEGFPRASARLGIDPSHNAEAAVIEAATLRALSPTTQLARHAIAGPNASRSGFELAFPAAVLWGLIGCAGAFAAASVAERRSGTHLRLRVAPLPWGTTLLGKLVAVVVACAVDATVLLVVARVAFGVRIERLTSLPLVVACCAICFAGITVLLGVLGRSEQGVGGASWATLLLMAMIGGAMVPLSVMPSWMRTLSGASPVKWGIVALEGATFRGLSLTELLPACAVLLGFGSLSLISGAALAHRAR